MSARATFESRCWEALAKAGYQPPPDRARKLVDAAFIDAILEAADEYAICEGGITAERRAVLDAAVRETDTGERAAAQQVRRGREADLRAVP